MIEAKRQCSYLLSILPTSFLFFDSVPPNFDCVMLHAPTAENQKGPFSLMLTRLSLYHHTSSMFDLLTPREAAICLHKPVSSIERGLVWKELVCISRQHLLFHAPHTWLCDYGSFLPDARRNFYTGGVNRFWSFSRSNQFLTKQRGALVREKASARFQSITDPHP